MTVSRDAEGLWLGVRAIVRELGITVWRSEGNPVAGGLSVYRPIVPPLEVPTLGYNGKIQSQPELAMIYCHEMLHALLHPPALGDSTGAETEAEELFVHHCANEVCRTFDVRNYHDFMQREGATSEEALPFFSAGLVTPVAALFVEAMDEPSRAGEWSSGDPASGYRGLILKAASES